MSRLVSCLLPVVLVLSACTPDNANNDGPGHMVAEHLVKTTNPAGYFSYGKIASAGEIAGWDIDIRPDGVGLPVGSGTAEDGEALYEDKCAVCHGYFGEGVGRNPVLSGGLDTLTSARPEKTVGSYWPYASTVWDYIHRAMPFTEPESLGDDDVYAISAYVLYLNDLVEYDFELNQDTLATIEMPNRNGFFLDDRPDVINELCMNQCKDPATIKITSEQLSSATENVDVDIETAGASTGAATYAKACAMCHASGVGEAPIPGDVNAWSERIAQGRDVLIQSSLTGKGIMPAKGGQTNLTDKDVIAAVDFMLKQLPN